MAITKRKLGIKARISLFKFAVEKFQAVELRAQIAEVHGQFLAAFHADYAERVEPHLDLLRATTGLVTQRSITLPVEVKISEKEMKQFELPNGETVERETLVTYTYDVPVERWYCGYFHSIQAMKIFAGAAGDEGVAEAMQEHAPRPRSMSCFSLLADMVLPMSVGGSLVLQRMMGRWSGNYGALPWVRPETWKLLDQFYVLGEQQANAEVALHRAIASVILQTDTFEDLLAVWPEAAEMAEELFPTKAKPINQMVVLSDEQKALLCSNMSSRGVESQLCAA